MNTSRRATWLAVLVCTLPLACEFNGDVDSPALGGADIERTTEALTSAPIAQSLLDAFKQSLKVDLLDPYYPAAHDGSYGGFVEDRSGTWVLQQDSDKFVSLQARLTWTAAKASQFYASNPTQAAQYRASAAVGFQFLTRMWLGFTSGFAMMSDRNGSNGRNTGKETYIVYGNAFGMYAAAAYYAASGDANALTLAINAYNYLNNYFYDGQYGGYYITAIDKRKETNTNVHVLEALIELYKDMPASHSLRPEVGSRISQLLGRFHDSAMHCPAANDCFAYPVMNQDWTASTSDVSFGHDLELSMLMVQAITALGGDPLASPYITKIKKVVDFTFTHGGYRSDGGFYYTGTYNSGSVSINDSQMQWWPQAEGLGALCLMRNLFPSDTFYEPTISKSWSFIDTQIIDHTNHGWVRQAGDWNIAKGWEWHCNYHNGRALMNCLTWLTGSTPPAPTCSDGIQNQGETGVDCGGPCPACGVCVPTTCSALGATCGTVSDGCGNTLSCGTCGTNQVCTANKCVCAPKTCASLGAMCGTVSDGCGNTLSCGTCATGKVCNASNQCVQSSGTGPFLESGGMVVMEAEHYTSLRQDLTFPVQWYRVAVSSASGGTVMQVGPDSTTRYHTAQADVQTNAARMDYPVRFTTAGTWSFWVRGASTTSNGGLSDSVNGGIDNTASALNFDFPQNGSYAWIKKTITVPSAGVHTIQLYMREDGFFADKIVLTTSSSFTPTNLGPAESLRQ